MRARAEYKGDVRRRCLIVVLAIVAVLAVAGPAVSIATEAPSWSSPVLVDHHPHHPNVTEVFLAGVSCPSQSLCIAVGRYGAFESSDPTAVVPTWTTVRDSPLYMDEVACPSTSLCVATRHLDAIQEVVSFNPTNSASPSFRSTHLSVGRFSCPAITLCVASDGAGGLRISTNPGAIHPVWRHYPTVYGTRESSGLSAISCASVRLCLGVDTLGQLVTSDDPGANVPHWHVHFAPGPYDHDSICRYLPITVASCVSPAFCMVADQDGKTFTSADPLAASPTWRSQPAPANIHTLSCPSTHLCVGDIPDATVVTTNTPDAMRPSWEHTTVADEFGDDAGGPTTTLTCVSQSMTCVVVDGYGYAIVGSAL